MLALQLFSKPGQEIVGRSHPQTRPSGYLGIVEEVLAVQRHQIVDLGAFRRHQDGSILGVNDPLGFRHIRRRRIGDLLQGTCDQKTFILGDRLGEFLLQIPLGLQQHLGEDLEGEVLRRILPRAVEAAIRDSELRPIGDPQLSNLRFEPGAPLTFTATLEVMPQVTIEGYSGLKLTRRQTEIREEDIHQVLDRLRDQNADLEEAEQKVTWNCRLIREHQLENIASKVFSWRVAQILIIVRIS